MSCVRTQFVFLIVVIIHGSNFQMLGATTYTWDSGVTGDWTTANNWDLNLNYPSQAQDDEARVNDGNVTLGSGNTLDMSLGDLKLGYTAGTNSIFTFSGANLSTRDFYAGQVGDTTMVMNSGNISSRSLNMGKDNSISHLEFNGGQWITSGEVQLGYSGTGTAFFTIRGGVFNTQSNHFAVGQTSTATGNFLMTGGALTTSTFFIGRYSSAVGQGNITGGNLTATNFYIGNSGSNQGYLDMSGGDIYTSGAFQVGGSGSGNMIMTGGNIIGPSFYVGNSGSQESFFELLDGHITATSMILGRFTSAKGKVIQRGGQFDNSGSMNIGNLSDQYAEYNLYAGNIISGGEVTLANNASSLGNLNLYSGRFVGDAIINISSSGLGTLNMYGGNLEVGSTLHIARNSGVGRFNLSSGNVQATSINVGNAGVAYFNMSGGNVNLSSQFNVGVNSSSYGNVIINAGNINAATTNLGYNDQGLFDFSGGTFSNQGDFYLGRFLGSGKLIAKGGYLDTNNLVVGNQGSGCIILSSGNILTSSFTLGTSSGASGNVDICGGNLITSTSSIGNSGNGMLEISSGNYTTNSLIIGNAATGLGNIIQSGGLTWIKSSLTVGETGGGQYTITGGNVFAGTNLMTLGTATGILDVSGGILEAGELKLTNSSSKLRVTGNTAQISLDKITNTLNDGELEFIFTEKNGDFRALQCRGASGMGGNLHIGLQGGAIWSTSNIVDLVSLGSDAGGSYLQTPDLWDLSVSSSTIKATLAPTALKANFDLGGASSTATFSASGNGYVKIDNIQRSNLFFKGLAITLTVNAGTENNVLQNLQNIGFQCGLINSNGTKVRIYLSPTEITQDSYYFAWDFYNLDTRTHDSAISSILIEYIGNNAIFKLY